MKEVGTSGGEAGGGGGAARRLLIVYHPRFAVEGYPALKDRVAPAFEELRVRGVLDREGVEVVEAERADEELALRVHTESHLRGVMNSGYYDIALLSAGGVVRGAREVAGGRVRNAFCFVGAAGHHASREGFWGFCYLNDVAMAVADLRERRGLGRVVVLDVDPHYGDGTRDILGPDASVMHINFHAGPRMGSDEGPNNVDVALPYDADDRQFLEAVDRVLPPAVDFRPELVFVVFGHDSHRDDYGAFELGDDVYGEFARRVKAAFPSGVCYVLSGGSRPHVARRAIGDVAEVLSFG